MDYKTVRFFMGRILMGFAATLVVPLLYAAFSGEKTVRAFLITATIMIVLGWVLQHYGNEDGKWGIKESFAIIVLTWIIAGLFAGLPYLLSGASGLEDAIFEGVSGLTATGATIFPNVEVLPRSLLLWRCLSHWLGGLGILVFFILFLPKIGGGAVSLFRAETSGPEKTKVLPRFKELALTLLAIYSTLTLLEIITLMLAGLPLFHAVNHAFSNIATGGFLTRNLSVRAWDSPAVTWITFFFMIVSGVNFTLYIQLRNRKFTDILKNTELRAYALIMTVGALVVMLSLILQGGRSVSTALSEGFFQTAAMMTTTGFAIADYAYWPSLAVMTLFLLMIVGGCSGSTSGGLKVVRVVLLFKMCRQHIQRLTQPNLVAEVKMDGQLVPENIVTGVARYLAIYTGIFAIAAWLLAAAGLEPFEAMGAVLASVGNVGMGFGSVGVAGHFAALNAFGKLVMTVCMFLGRLEFMAFLVLCQPDFWRSRRNW
jgi:trk system potassium uptake protein TrkH